MKLGIAVALAVSVVVALAAPFDQPPTGYALVAEDDCGNPDEMSHVVRGKAYVFAPELVSGSPEDRDIIFDDDFCLLRYEKLDPDARHSSGFCSAEPPRC